MENFKVRKFYSGRQETNFFHSLWVTVVSAFSWSLFIITQKLSLFLEESKLVICHNTIFKAQENSMKNVER